MTGGRPRVFAGHAELLIISLQVCQLVLQAADSRTAAALYAKVVGNLVAERMPLSVKRRALVAFFAAVGGSKRWVGFAVELVKQIDRQLNESDRQALWQMLEEDDGPQR